jgi:hypothetical protein
MEQAVNAEQVLAVFALSRWVESHVGPDHRTRISSP